MSYNKDLYNRQNKKVISIVALSIVGVLLVVLIFPIINPSSVSIANSSTNPNTNTNNINSAPTPVVEEVENSIVPLDQIVSGGPPPDGIPSIDNPKFISVGSR